MDLDISTPGHAGVTTARLLCVRTAPTAVGCAPGCAALTPGEAGGFNANLVGALGYRVCDARIGHLLRAGERQLQQLGCRRAGQCLALLGGQRLRQLPSHAGDHHARAARGDHTAELLQNQRDTKQIHRQHADADACDGESPAVCTTWVTLPAFTAFRASLLTDSCDETSTC